MGFGSDLHSDTPSGSPVLAFLHCLLTWNHNEELRQRVVHQRLLHSEVS